MATQDVRMELIQHEYTGMRNALHTLMDRMDGYEAAVLGLTEAVSQNGERIEALEERMVRVEQRLELVEQVVLENRSILLTIADHLDLTLEKPPQNPQSD
ncbi:MAG: hypothetical protein OXG85_00875 [Chloroflexi bacterium]|nr:hypothetical protein [Chloroflexota bacterium]